jgi:hypothetical protein
MLQLGVISKHPVEQCTKLYKGLGLLLALCAWLDIIGDHVIVIMTTRHDDDDRHVCCQQ